MDIDPSRGSEISQDDPPAGDVGETLTLFIREGYNDVDSTFEETLEQRYKRLTLAVKRKYIIEEAEAIERELAGETSPRSTVIVGYKRGVLSSAESSTARRLFIFRFKELALFEGKSLKEIFIYKTRWEVEFHAAPDTLIDIQRIVYAAIRLRGTPLET